MKNILQIENLSISFRTDEGTFNMIKDLSYSVGEGEIVGIVGESGCGKTISSLCHDGTASFKRHCGKRARDPE